MENTSKTAPTYHIEYKHCGQKVLIAKEIPSMELAVKFALNLHEASNAEHLIHVIHEDVIDVTFVRYDQSTNV